MPGGGRDWARVEGVDALRGGLAVDLGMEVATLFGAGLGGFDRQGMGLGVGVLADAGDLPVDPLSGGAADGEGVVR